MSKYQPQQFEKKWREKWSSDKLNDFVLDDKKKPYYTLVELPYTSGDLHIGHWFTFTPADVLSRYKRMTGMNVFFPIGYDAFGLPAENAAMKHNIHPQDWTMKNVETMTAQFQTMGTMLNWKDVVIACLPEYYRWNQWIFIKMFERGIAYRGKMLSNWCETDQTVLANENIENGNCWRCGNPVVQKEVEQWFLKITDYADKLIWPHSAPAEAQRAKGGSVGGKPDASTVDWPIEVKVGQNNWIGKSEGVELEFPVILSEVELNSTKSKDLSTDSSTSARNDKIRVFTTALDTIFGVTFLVLAPEHPIISSLNNSEIKKYVERAKNKTEEQRKIDVKEKTGIFTNLYATNPVSGEKIPVWVADYVLASYGTGAVMGVPGHDARDHEFAKKFGITIKSVVKPTKNIKVDADGFWDYVDIKTKYQDDSILFNSGEFDGLTSREGKKKLEMYLEKNKIGARKVQYRLHDWSISRQRYWGTPVPMIHCGDCGIVPVPEKDLPVELPYKVDFTPKGKPPLATNEDWLDTTCPKCGKPAKRDAETLDTFFDSAWYWFRYLSPHYEKGPFDTEMAKKLTPVDVYFGGSEHTVGHTLYARFFTKFFKDLGLIDYDEFAKKRIQHGVVRGPDGNRMSKSKGNVINPDDVVGEYGTDAVRLYLCFMMPYEATGPWSDKTIAGVYRFLKRVWEKYQNPFTADDKNLVSKLNQTIKKVGGDIKKMKMNTAIAAMMEFINEWDDVSGPPSTVNDLSSKNAKAFLQILAPFTPHMAEEIWHTVFGEKESIHLSSWPEVDEKAIVADVLRIPVQVNGRVRSVITVSDTSEDTVVKKALQDEKVKAFVDGKKYKVIYVPGKILNLVV